MLNLRHGGTTWMSSKLFHELQTWFVIIKWSLRSLILAHGTITPFFSTGSENRVAKPFFVPQTGFLLHSVKPLYAAALCVCVRSFGVMWKCGELNGSGISPALLPVTYGSAHDRQGTACFICGQGGLFTFLLQLPPPRPALSCRSPSFFFYLNPIRALTRPHISCSSCCNAEVYWQFAQSLSREVFASFYLLPVWFTFVDHIH